MQNLTMRFVMLKKGKAEHLYSALHGTMLVSSLHVNLIDQMPNSCLHAHKIEKRNL